MDDHALLQEELHWRSGPGHSRRPAGTNAITAIGIVITLVLWGITGIVLTPLLSGPRGSGVIEPRSIVVIVVFGVEMLVAAAVSGRVWVAIGPGARGALRPFGVLGPLPMLVMAFFVVISSASFVLAPFMPRKAAPTTAGRNWRFVKTDRLGVTYEHAVQMCKEAGERVPSREDLALFDPPFPGLGLVWLEKPPDAKLPIVLDRDLKVGSFSARPGSSPHAYVVCFRP